MTNWRWAGKWVGLGLFCFLFGNDLADSSSVTAVTASAVATSVPTSAIVSSSVTSLAGAGNALRFLGNGVDDIDRAKIAIDDPGSNAAGPPADIGATDFTIEFWLKAERADNRAAAVTCGAGVAWINGNIVIDRDRYNQGRKFGLSLAGGRVVWGVSGDNGDFTICGTTNVLDGQWHHIAVQRRLSDGQMWIYVDGNEDAAGDGPDGDVSYPDDGVAGNFCDGPCVNSDPFLVIGAEKHDAGAAYPSYHGLFDELHLSTVLRYAQAFGRPTLPFAPDAHTAALYHFDEAAGATIIDSSGAAGGPSNGVLKVGGDPAGPRRVTSDAPLQGAPGYKMHLPAIFP